MCLPVCDAPFFPFAILTHSLGNRTFSRRFRFYFLKEFHGKGDSDRLMNFAMDYARSQGFERMYLSVWEYNFRARGFYEKNGFKNTGIENDFPLGNTPQTDLWFVKNLCN